MDERIKRLIFPMLWAAAIIFAICCLIKTPETAYDYYSYVGHSISGVSILFVLYERWLWRFIPWNRPPVLRKKYEGTISYVYNDQPGSKEISISVKQTLFSVKISTRTDINSSHTVLGSIVFENSIYALYYIYVTEPSPLQQNENPSQLGTCRMLLDGDMSRLRGKYWTTSRTIGDIEWRKPTESGG